MIPSGTKRCAERHTDSSTKKIVRRDPSPSIAAPLRKMDSAAPSAKRIPAVSSSISSTRKMTAPMSSSARMQMSTMNPSSLGMRGRATIASAREIRKPVVKTPMDIMKEEMAALKKDLELKNQEVQCAKQREEELQRSSAQKEEDLKRSSAQKEQDLKRSLEQRDSLLEAERELTASLRQEALQADASLRTALNQLVDLKGQVRVAVRVRPPIEDEISSSHLEYPSPTSIVLKAEKVPSSFECTRVFSPAITQAGVYKEISDVVQSSMDGYNVSIIAYGQTGSGKTFTMFGGQSDERGIVPRAVEDMFAYQEKKRILNWEFTFSASYLEIYNDVCYDLLNKRQKVSMRCTTTGAAFENLSTVPIKNPEQIIDLITAAGLNRVTAKTACNAQSSRSHAIFQLHVFSKQLDEGSTFLSRLDLVDLAGSERAKESLVEGEQFKEMTCINQSLSTLMQCIRAARCKSKHVPYRDSKLTTALRSSIGGNSKTMMIVAVNPSMKHVVESKRSLEFAQQVSSMKMGLATSQLK